MDATIRIGVRDFLLKIGLLDSYEHTNSQWDSQIPQCTIFGFMEIHRGEGITFPCLNFLDLTVLTQEIFNNFGGM